MGFNDKPILALCCQSYCSTWRIYSFTRNKHAHCLITHSIHGTWFRPVHLLAITKGYHVPPQANSYFPLFGIACQYGARHHRPRPLLHGWVITFAGCDQHRIFWVDIYRTCETSLCMGLGVFSICCLYTTRNMHAHSVYASKVGQGTRAKRRQWKLEHTDSSVAVIGRKGSVAVIGRKGAATMICFHTRIRDFSRPKVAITLPNSPFYTVPGNRLSAHSARDF